MKKKLGFAFLLVLLLALAGMAVLTPPVRSMGARALPVTRWEKSEGKVTRLVGPQQPGWLSLEHVSFHTIHAIVTAEDARFFQHWGIDFRQIAISCAENWRKGRYARGASTITQQVVKLLYLDNDKTMVRKLREMSGALFLELLMDKNSILEWYLNLVNFGSGVYGIASAAQFYFATRPELLTIPQSILLASVVPSPNRWSDSLRNKSLSPVGEQRFLFILFRMRSEGFINRQQCRIALRTGNFGRPLLGGNDARCE